jgi:hypothetical protein
VQKNDGDAGLMHVGARYYDAQVGRFITRDTVLSEHPYLYCEHEPVSRVDPSGHFNFRKALEAVKVALDMYSTILTGPSPGPPEFTLPPPAQTAIVGPPPPWWNGGRVPLLPGFEIVDPPGPGPWVRPRPGPGFFGSGGGSAGIFTIGQGAGVFADGMRQTVNWRRRIEAYLDENGNWY